MARPLVGPGKTAPKLYQDVLGFDPNNGRPNILVEHAPPSGEGRPLGTPIGSCQHEYTTKVAQSILPPLDVRPDETTVYKVATICKKCRVHMQIRIDYTHTSTPCPTEEFPVHHFQRNAESDVIDQDGICYHWQCSAPGCRAMLQIGYRPPRVSKEELNLLSNTELLKSRFETVVERDPTRDGIRQATPSEALHRLRKYIKDSLNPEHTKRSFPAHNKRFMEAFGWYGHDCRVLLGRLGFQYDDEEIQWTLPDPPAIADRLHVPDYTHREYLEDVEMELLAWMNNLALTTGAINLSASEQWTSANRDIERTLQAQGYQRYVSSRRMVANGEPEYFASLGALPEFHDSLIEFAYDRQTECDPMQAPYYFECLQVITEARGTEQLQMRVSVLASQNVISRRDLATAFRNLGLQSMAGQTMSDEAIVQHFYARMHDLGPNAADQAKRALHLIGLHRNSVTLLKVSRQSIETYEDALTWLGNGMSSQSTDDEILTAFAIRTGDVPGDVEIGRKAITIISQERKSDMLDTWLLTGRTDGQTMSVDEALRHLGVDIKLDHLDHTVLPAMFESARADRPGEQTERAIATIQKNLAGPRLTGRTLDDWPVGLISHGNTCYLNSLLQYYFSIRDFRNIVLNYKDFELDTKPFEDDPSRKKEARVGGLRRSFDVIKGAQYFAEDLQCLFTRMIKASNAAVRPETDLVCRAFLRPEDWALLDASKQNRDLPQSNDYPITTESTAHTVLEPSLVTDATHDSGNISMASSQTLQGSPEPEQRETLVTANELPPTPPDSPGQMKLDSQHPSLPKAPALPPRPISIQVTESPLALAERNAREQQDVTEVHDAALDRLRIGMNPDGVDADGEQIDGLRNLFSIDMIQTPVNNGVQGRPRPVPTTAIQLNVPEPNAAIDIYSALDDFFDLQPVEDNPSLESYKSLRVLPPLFQISIPRAGYDAQTGAFFKSNGCVKLEDELYLDRYMDNPEHNILPLRRESWGWRKRLQACRAESKGFDQAQTGLNKAALLRETASYVNSMGEVDELLREVGIDTVGVDEELYESLRSEAEHSQVNQDRLQSEIEALERQLQQQFAEFQQVKYRLAAVFIHRGSQGGGHYWIYIHDFARKIWRSYNDENVEEFTQLANMYEARGGAQNAAPPQGTPTYVVYVRDELKEQLIQPVCRAPEPEPETDVSMSSGQPPESFQSAPRTQAERLESLAAEAVKANGDAAHGETSHVEDGMVIEGQEGSWDPERRVSDAKW